MAASISDLAGFKRDSGWLRAIRNPLVVLGLILLGGDGPLLVALALVDDSHLQRVLTYGLVGFVFLMGACFIFLVVWGPRNLYSPSEFPAEVLDRDIYGEMRRQSARHGGRKAGRADDPIATGEGSPQIAHS